jgi:adenylate cyclase
VLPFQNMSGDPEQEYFADGMVEEITTALSRVRAFFVIARNSSFAYKGKSPDVRQVGRELGVRYVLEGSVRKSGDRIRITGQLIDATTGAHVWANRFDGGLEDIFDLQDQITASVVGAIEPKLRKAEIERAQHKPTENLHAYDLFLRAADYGRLVRLSAKDTEAAIGLLRQAVKLDPGFAIAHALMAEYLWGSAAQLRRDPPDPMAIEAVQIARIALALDGDDPEVLWRVSAVIASPGGRLDEALAMAEKSLALNPNSAGALRAHARLLGYLGDTETAVSQLQRATRLSPMDVRPFLIEFDYATIYFGAGRYDLVLEWSEKALRSMPGYLAALRYKIASLGLLGRLEEGRLAVQEILAATPELTVRRARAHIEIGMNNVFKTPGFADAMCRGLRLAGIPE